MPTKINWCDETLNIISGCTRVSPGCDHCWACQLAATRLAHLPQYQGVARIQKNKIAEWTGKLYFHPEVLRKVLHWRKPRRIFWNSMSDTFHPAVKDDWIDQIIEHIAASSQHQHLILTKRPKRMQEIAKIWDLGVLSHLWLGVSVENQAVADERISILLGTSAAVRWVNIEPLLEEINLIPYLPNLNWVVISCDSGPRRRICKLAWVGSLIRQCTSAKVPVWIKQLDINGRVSHNPAEWPDWARRGELP